MILDINLTSFTNINMKWILGLHLKYKTTKFLEGKRVDNFSFYIEVLDTKLKVQSMEGIRQTS